MGYEVQMLVGRVHKNMKGYTEETKDKCWFSIYATVDLCKPGPAKILELKDAAKADPVYVYAIMGDGDTMTLGMFLKHYTLTNAMNTTVASVGQ